MGRKIAIRVILVIIVIAFGFIYLIRSCLSKFDERSSVGGGSSSQSASQFLVFEKDGKGVIFSLVKYDRTDSYSQQGGMTRKSVTVTYYAQTNDLATAAKIKTEKIKKGREIKSYPVDIMGAAGDKAWIFAGELMAYDPFTLNKIVDAAILEEKNPVLKGKLINENRYYEFDNETKQIRITAADGAIYMLNTSTLVAAPAGDDDSKEPGEKEMAELDKKLKTLRMSSTMAYDRLRNNNQQYRDKTLSVKQYQDSAKAIQQEITVIRQAQDSLEKIVQGFATKLRAVDDEKRRKDNAKRMGSSFSGIKTNSDTMNGHWYGLYNATELTNLNDRFDYRNLYDDAARNKLYTASITEKDNYWIIDESREAVGDVIYLQGGFLLSKETGLPFHLQQDFLVVYKDRIGNDGLIQLARISSSGKQLWTINTGLKEFHDWQVQGTHMLLGGTDNKDLSSGEVNLLQIVNLSNGSVVAYDFFKDKVRN